MISLVGHTISLTPEVLVQVMEAMPESRPIKKICFTLCVKADVSKAVHSWPIADSDSHVVVVTFVPEDVAEA